MLKVGIAGIGFMGMTHYRTYQRVRGAKVTAICTRDPKKRAGDWRAIKGNFGEPGSRVDLGKAARYERIDDLLADPDVDLVDICLPPSLHADMTIRALRAGKHVFCEKPIALTAADANRMVDAAQKFGRMLLVGHVLPYFPEFAFIYRLATSGKYGQILGGNFKRVISDPQWLPNFYNPKLIGGPMLDLHVHDAHLIRLLFGMPKGVFSTGRMRGDVAEYFSTVFTFNDPQRAVTATSGCLRQQGRTFTHGFEVHFERATVLFDLAVYATGVETNPLSVLTAKGTIERPQLDSGDVLDAFAAEVADVVKSVRSGKPAPILAAELARDAVQLCQRQAQSIERGRPVNI